VRGASALQAVLDRVPGEELSVLVVWEPVIASDLGPPTESVRNLLSDPRTVHFWDEDRLLSKTLVHEWTASGIRIESGDRRNPDVTIWDFVAVFPRGAHWNGTLPEASHYGSPVVEQVEEVRAKLFEAMRGERASPSPGS